MPSAPSIHKITAEVRTPEVLDGGSAAPQATNLTSSVYEQIRAEVLTGKLRPGEKLSPAGLRDRFGTGGSPVREALNRLLSEGYVSLEDNKGFRVASVSQQELRELVTARCWVDGISVSEAIKEFDIAWEENLVLALHRLSKVSRINPQQYAEWERLHKAFHVALVSGCGSRWMVKTSGRFFDAAERYRMLAENYVSERNELEEHREIVDACLERNPKRAVELIKLHYARTYEEVISHSLMPIQSKPLGGQ